MIDLQKEYRLHFDKNTLIKPITLDKKGEYTIKNDIIIDFNPTYPPKNEINKFSSLRYGYFTAIMIIGKNITLDLQGHEIKMSKRFHLQQRKFAIIQLNNTLFPRFGELPIDNLDFKKASNIHITNGKLGLCSYISINGQENFSIKISKMKIYDFEKCGISLNGCTKINLNNLTVGPNLNDLWVNENLESANQLLHHFYNVLPQLKEPTDTFLQLQKLVNQTISATSYEDVPKLFQNEVKVPIGNVFGISIFRIGDPLREFGYLERDQYDSIFSSDITMRKIKITNLYSQTIRKKNYKYNDKYVRDFSGQNLDFNYYIENSNWNELLIVQLESSSWTRNYRDFISSAYIPDGVASLLNTQGYNNILNRIQQILTVQVDLKPLLQIEKGVIACRLDSCNDLKINDLIIANIYNKSEINETTSLQTTALSNFEDVYELTCFDANGLILNHVKNLYLENISIEQLESVSGTSFGIIAMNKCLKASIVNTDLSLSSKSLYQYGITIQDSCKYINVLNNVGILNLKK